jgi:hypothetical protein
MRVGGSDDILSISPSAALILRYPKHTQGGSLFPKLQYIYFSSHGPDYISTTSGAGLSATSIFLQPSLLEFSISLKDHWSPHLEIELMENVKLNCPNLRSLKILDDQESKLGPLYRWVEENAVTFGHLRDFRMAQGPSPYLLLELSKLPQLRQIHFINQYDMLAQLCPGAFDHKFLQVEKITFRDPPTSDVAGYLLKAKFDPPKLSVVKLARATAKGLAGLLPFLSIGSFTITELELQTDYLTPSLADCLCGTSLVGLQRLYLFAQTSIELRDDDVRRIVQPMTKLRDLRITRYSHPVQSSLTLLCLQYVVHHCLEIENVDLELSMIAYTLEESPHYNNENAPAVGESVQTTF